jgi:hypothetical protein
MAKQKSKAELLNDILVERTRLERNLDNLTEMEMTQPGVVGEWSIKDVLAHLTAWEELFLSWYAAGVQGREPEIPPVGMGKKAIDALNQKIFAQYRQTPLNEVLTEFHASFQQILTVLQTVTEEDLFSPRRYAWTGNLVLADYVAGNTCNHDVWAKTQIHRWLKNRVVSPQPRG